jgi:hypothetical protein
MNKKINFLVVCLFLLSMTHTCASPKSLIKNVSQLYVGTALGLWATGSILHKLSGAPEYEIVGKLRKRKVYFKKYDTDSLVKKALSRAADTCLVANEAMVDIAIMAVVGIFMAIERTTYTLLVWKERVAASFK